MWLEGDYVCRAYTYFLVFIVATWFTRYLCVIGFIIEIIINAGAVPTRVC